MDGWWDCERIDEMMHRVYTAEKLIVDHINTPSTIIKALPSKLLPHGSKWRSKEIGKFHYDIGNDFYEAILDPYFNYTCGYWAGGARTLEDAQIAKMDRICRKLRLQPGMKLLDIGCGWGGFAKFAAERYGVHVTGISVSEEQLKHARKLCEGLDVEVKYLDYRNLEEKFDRITTIGMIEHVGPRYYRAFMEKVSSCLSHGGIFVLHTLGFNTSDYKNPWLQKYIFPGGFIPSLRHIARAHDGLLTEEHIENIGYDYCKTLLCWCNNLEKNWDYIQSRNPEKYDERFFRTWRFYLLATAAGFLVGKALVWHFVFSKGWVEGGYAFPMNEGDEGAVMAVESPATSGCDTERNADAVSRDVSVAIGR
jgi:cyclopropane-fatty-acyl-phospholipid synthase